jgi:hypothetical protein
MSDAGAGSRGIVIGYKEGSEFSHAFNVVNQNGTIRILDGQIGGLRKRLTSMTTGGSLKLIKANNDDSI